VTIKKELKKQISSRQFILPHQISFYFFFDTSKYFRLSCCNNEVSSSKEVVVFYIGSDIIFCPTYLLGLKV